MGIGFGFLKLGDKDKGDRATGRNPVNNESWVLSSPWHQAGAGDVANQVGITHTEEFV